MKDSEKLRIRPGGRLGLIAPLSHPGDRISLP